MKAVYLEPDEEITSVVERLSQLDDKNLAIVVPKNSTLFQSLVNLKLLARQAKKLGKNVAIISTNKVGTKLAKQVGLEAYANLGNVSQSGSAGPVIDAAAAPMVPDTLPDGTPINRYSADGVMAPVIPIPADEPEEPAENGSTEEPLGATDSTDLPSEPLIPVVDSPPVETPTEAVESSKTPPTSSTTELPSIVSRGIKTTAESTFIFPWKSAAIAGGMVLIAAIITFLFLPKATVTMTFPAKLLAADFTLAAKTTPAGGDGTIPGNLLTVNQTGTLPITASGKKDVGTKASGTISIKNCEDTNSHSLSAGAKATASSKVFLTNTSVVIPAGTFSHGGNLCTSSTVSVGITASEAGDPYNLANATFTLADLSSRIAGIGSTTGGTTKQVTILSQDDVDKAYANLKTQTAQSATDQLKTKAGSQTILEPAIKQIVQEQKVDKAVGSQTDGATATMTLEVYTIAFDSAAVATAAKSQLTQKLEPNQQLVVPEDKKAVPTFKDLSDDRTTLNLVIAASGFATPSIDKLAVTKLIKNKSVATAQKELKDKYQAQEVKIEIIPSWFLKRLPILSQAISVDYGFNAIPGT